MRDIILNEVLIPSLCALYEVDYDNIRFGVSERNICARLAHHMECFMRKYDDLHYDSLFIGYYADVEYNRMGNGDLKRYENSEHRPKYMVSDLIIQKRGYGRNLLAIEMKRKGNHHNIKDDKERLKSLVSSQISEDFAFRCVHDTFLGAFIVYSMEGVVVELFENRNGRGQKIENLTFQYCLNQFEGGSLIQI